MKRIPFLLVGVFLLAIAFASRPHHDVVTFTADIKPIIDKKCLSCHVKGGSAPFPLVTYAQVKKRADLCRRMMLTHEMPPCTAHSDFGEFCIGGGPLTDEEGITLQHWIDGGSQEGSPSVPAIVTTSATWRLGKPDAVLTPQGSVDVPEEGRPYWKAFVLPLTDLEGRNLSAFDIHAKQPLVIRSAMVAVARPGLLGTQRAREGWETGGSLDIDAKKYLGVWAPGYPVWQLPNGVSMSLDGNAIVVQILYLPRGKAESGDFELALYFSKSSKDSQANWLTLAEEKFAVPAPGSLVLRPEGMLPKHAEVLAMIPEARFFCTSIRLWGNGKMLFATRRWEPYWQGPSRFEKPVEFPDGAQLKTEFNYDNDIHMGRNEGRRPRPILPGTRERDELCRIHVLYAIKR